MFWGGFYAQDASTRAEDRWRREEHGPSLLRRVILFFKPGYELPDDPSFQPAIMFVVLLSVIAMLVSDYKRSEIREESEAKKSRREIRQDGASESRRLIPAWALRDSPLLLPP